MRTMRMLRANWLLVAVLAPVLALGMAGCDQEPESPVDPEPVVGYETGELGVMGDEDNVAGDLDEELMGEAVGREEPGLGEFDEPEPALGESEFGAETPGALGTEPDVETETDMPEDVEMPELNIEEGAVMDLEGAVEEKTDGEQPEGEAAEGEETQSGEDAAAGGEEGQSVAVGLTEFAIDMPTSLPPGPTTFNVTNEGEAEHTIEVEGQGIEEVLEPHLQPGESGTLQVDLQPGTYTVYCPIANHAEQGMTLELNVEENK